MEPRRIWCAASLEKFFYATIPTPTIAILRQRKKLERDPAGFAILHVRSC